jgi:hypothetical protein
LVVARPLPRKRGSPWTAARQGGRSGGGVGVDAKNLHGLGDVPLMPMRNSMRCSAGGVVGDHLLLHLDRTAHRVDDAGELDAKAVEGGLGPRALTQRCGRDARRF